MNEQRTRYRNWGEDGKWRWRE
ncbi:hypothetical protein I5H17_gp089 [Mycobacterium phage BodEinwohner17]|uniref:Uncharacterized protein n=1 Tax=Mycobacterium phage BodEinwohner17 TaxID=2708630 RepID=A0A6G6XSL3_9CAUD|nr:hypothetical protein I5H17_gp089 [Mycobacterium phage BodEinwohner17]QIG61483.1 hypothetical protein SEA_BODEINWOHNER17_89 [Mycobacterium phage BodEinwohner17]